MIEAAHFDPVASPGWPAGTSCSSEASRRFERGVDPELPPVASTAGRAAAAPTSAAPTYVGVDRGRRPAAARHDRARPGPAGPHRRRADRRRATSDAGSREVGCAVDAASDAAGCVDRRRPGGPTSRTPPTSTRRSSGWSGYEHVPVAAAAGAGRAAAYDRAAAAAPPGRPGAGRTPATSRRRRTRSSGAADLDAARPAGRTTTGATPCGWPTRSPSEEPLLRTTLLPGLLAALRRNVGRGMHDVALFEVGPVFRPGRPPRRRRRGSAVDRRPSDEELAALEAALPAQPRRVAVVLAGAPRAGRLVGSGPRRRPGPTPSRRPGRSPRGRRRADGRAPTSTRRGTRAAAPRCARATGSLVGHAGELHPRVVEALGLPARTCAMELDLDLLRRTAPTGPGAAASRPTRSATQDVALVVDAAVPRREVEAALRTGAGELLESLRLFDVYRGEQVGRGQGLAGLRAALPRARPHADRRGAGRRPRGRGRRGGPARRRRPARLMSPAGQVALVTGRGGGSVARSPSRWRPTACWRAWARTAAGTARPSPSRAPRPPPPSGRAGGSPAAPAVAVPADVTPRDQVRAAVDTVSRGLGPSTCW